MPTPKELQQAMTRAYRETKNNGLLLQRIIVRTSDEIAFETCIINSRGITTNLAKELLGKIEDEPASIGFFGHKPFYTTPA